MAVALKALTDTAENAARERLDLWWTIHLAPLGTLAVGLLLVLRASLPAALGRARAAA
jgi:hypothetical protein